MPYVGDSLLLRAKIMDPITKRPVTAGTVAMLFYDPSKKPEIRTADRDDQNETVSLTYDADVAGWIGSVNTDGWDAGRWTVCTTISGAYAARTYTSFDLKR